MFTAMCFDFTRALSSSTGKLYGEFCGEDLLGEAGGDGGEEETHLTH